MRECLNDSFVQSGAHDGLLIQFIHSFIHSILLSFLFFHSLFHAADSFVL